MKNTFHYTAILFFSLLLTSCFPDDEIGPDGLKQKTGKFLINTKQTPQKLKELTNTNARSANTNAVEVYEEYILSQDGKEVFRGELTSDTIEAPVGTYDITVQGTIVGDPFDGELTYQATESLLIESDTVWSTTIWYLWRVYDVELELVNLDGAKAWVGPVGFEPSDQWLYDFEVTYTTMYGEAYDIVVEFEGERKRYTTETEPGYIYFVKITREDEEATKGKTVLEMYPEDRNPEFIEYMW